MEKKLILHRGYKFTYPENSKLSFEMALKENKSFETDIRVSKDGVCFMIHDDSLDHLFNGSGKIKEMTSDELNDFHYREDETQKLCSLKEMCELIKENSRDSLIFIHIKESEDIDDVIKVLEEYDFSDKIRFFAVDEIEESFEKIMKEKYSKYKIGLYLPENSDNYNEERFKDADFIWADEINFPWMTKEKVELAHSLGKPFYAISPELIPISIFNSDIEKRWKELLESNVDRICTDLPERFLEFAKNR
jgi:glycerophosphoryl diester phosphodiesterase|tara:strand:+ start:30769 stop:31515 length:747 start_codon:yes stop_codon:yes gene_type:complete